MADLTAYGIPVKEKDIDRRCKEIEPLDVKRGKYALHDLVGYCIDRAKDAYILGMPDVCSLFSGKSIEEALSIAYRRKKESKKIPPFKKLVEWAKKEGVLDASHARIAHVLRGIRNDYAHAFFSVLERKLKKSSHRAPFTDNEALGAYEKAVNVLAYTYRNNTVKQLAMDF